MVILYASLFILWLIGYINAMQAFSNDPEANTLSRIAINAACILWPIAVVIALVRIVFGIKSNVQQKH